MVTDGSIEAPAKRPQIDHVFALRRSGHHAVIAWLQDCYRQKGLSAFHANSVFNEHLGWQLHSPDPQPEEILESAVAHDVLIANYEDVAYRDRADSPVFNRLRAESDAGLTRNIVVVRDWYNMVASRLKYIDDARTIGRYTITAALDWPTVANRWIDHATTLREALGNGVVGVSYNAWFADKAYRSRIALSLGLPCAETTLDTVPKYGLGSSFDGFEKAGKARSMNVLHRWQDLNEALLPEYIEAIGAGGPTVDELNQELFGFSYSEVTISLR